MNQIYLESIKYENNKLEIIDQLLLPQQYKYLKIESVDDACTAITRMQIRGAPAIAIVGVLSIAVELRQKCLLSSDDLKESVKKWLRLLVLARPTAVNIKNAQIYFSQLIDNFKGEPEKLKNILISEMEKYRLDDIICNKQIANHGADHIIKMSQDNIGQDDNQYVSLLTHCNTGSLATAGYGTALGVVRSIHEKGYLKMCYFTETRPYNQGARLTAFELIHDKIPSTLICDSMVAMLISTKKITAIVVGADRIASNGDTANKIGTLQLAILANFYKIKFYIAAPTTTIDWQIDSGDQINIEERSPNEMTFINGVRIAAEGVNCWNPAFDVTPCNLITGGIITEYGIFASNNINTTLKNLITNVRK